MRGGLELAQDRELHHVRDTAVGEQAREETDQVVDEVPAPVVERPVAGELLVRIDGHLVEARDDDVVPVLGLEHVQIDLRAGDALGDAVAKRVRERGRDGLTLDVDGVHVLGAVERELHRQEAAAAADVETPLAGADVLAHEVLPDEQAADGRNEDVRTRARAPGTGAGTGAGPRRRPTAGRRSGPARAANPARSVGRRAGCRPSCRRASPSRRRCALASCRSSRRRSGLPGCASPTRAPRTPPARCARRCRQPESE